MKKILLPVFSAIIIVSCKEEPKQDWYEFTGKVKNVPDSSMVYLSNDNGNIDSTLVLGEIFRFTGKVAKPTEFRVMIPQTGDDTWLWFENNKMALIAEKGKFSVAAIRGSKAQMEANILKQRMRPIEKSFDSLRPLFSESPISEYRMDSLLAASAEIKKKKMVIEQNFVEEYPNSYEGLDVLDAYKFAWGRETTAHMFASMNREHQESPKGKAIARYIETSSNPQPGDQYVNFEQENKDGRMIRLSEVKGKYTLVEFWASWCGSSRAGHPELVQTYNRFNKKGFEVIGISLDTERDDWITAVEKDGLPWENVNDLKGRENEAAVIYSVSETPETILIDENGTIIARNIKGEKLTNKLEELFSENQIAASK